MNTSILSIFTRTPLHVGAGASVGAVDQPVIRERHTGLPCIPGSAIKGVIADLFLQKITRPGKEGKEETSYVRTEEGVELLGKENAEQSGSISFGEGKLLAFPVRSAKGCFAWVTSPLAVNRWLRDTGLQPPAALPEPKGTTVYAVADLQTADRQVLLEGYLFQAQPLAPAWVELLKQACPDPMWAEMLPTHLLLAADEWLSHFCTTSCEIAQHVRINDETGTAADRALFNQENVPAETLFYAPLTELRPGMLEKLHIPAVMQIGADATTGLGFCSTALR